MALPLLDLVGLLEPLLWWRFDPRHKPPREDMRVLGDISPRYAQPGGLRDGGGSKELRRSPAARD
jgi:hypothetical protein